jgi:hypothetical protein
MVDLFVRNISPKHAVIESSEHTHDFINEEENVLPKREETKWL